MLEIDKIYNIDCLEGMRSIPDNSIDCIVTSPPYNKGEKKNSGVLVGAVKYDNYEDTMAEEDYQKNQILVLDEMYRILKNGGSVFYNHKNRYEDGVFISPLYWIKECKLQVRQEIIWNRVIAANLRAWRFWSNDERIYWLQKRKGTEIPMDYAKLGSVWTVLPEKEKRGHPCPFPQKITDICIGATCKKGNIVLDPYMGSGTTAISAIKPNVIT